MRVSTRRVRELRHARGTAVPGRVHGRDAHATPNNWHLLRDRRMGFKFRRQYPIENHIVDFYCCECRLAIELDGGVHSQPSQIKKLAATVRSPSRAFSPSRTRDTKNSVAATHLENLASEYSGCRTGW